MRHEDIAIKIQPEELVGKVSGLQGDGCRLVQIACSKTKENNFELVYSFEKDYKFCNLTFEVPPDAEVESISSMCFSAFLYENEIHDLFGLKIKHIAVDFQGTLYETAVKYPMSVETK